MATPSR